MQRHYGKTVRIKDLKPDDLVLRSNAASGKEHQDKLTPEWEGPYKIVWSNGKGSHKLVDIDGKDVPRTWNSMQLRITMLFMASQRYIETRSKLHVLLQTLDDVLLQSCFRLFP
ncbi:hypothetical protein E3N88_05998 [Mikania micrantha]|uniref:Integrase zinc-binding domain-containing protein n=1 Tax=Mikania micrantha TaxID=192012 RepID=A0A5N6PNE2_9ASTR|nr:hypothetical protein E3N88_05998 [Mikania micrantha]